jgi:hypothetical protein
LNSSLELAAHWHRLLLLIVTPICILLLFCQFANGRQFPSVIHSLISSLPALSPSLHGGAFLRIGRESRPIPWWKKEADGARNSFSIPLICCPTLVPPVQMAALYLTAAGHNPMALAHCFALAVGRLKAFG